MKLTITNNNLREIEYLYTADRETGTFIDMVDSVEDGLRKIKEYEDFDKADGNYTEDFYDVVNADHVSVL